MPGFGWVPADPVGYFVKGLGQIRLFPYDPRRYLSVFGRMCALGENQAPGEGLPIYEDDPPVKKEVAVGSAGTPAVAGDRSRFHRCGRHADPRGQVGRPRPDPCLRVADIPVSKVSLGVRRLFVQQLEPAAPQDQRGMLVDVWVRADDPQAITPSKVPKTFPRDVLLGRRRPVE